MSYTIKGKEKIQIFLPKIIKNYKDILSPDSLIEEKDLCVSFGTENFTTFKKKGSYVVLDFGKEYHGGVRIITRESEKLSKFRITFGESLSEAYSKIGEKNATNDHSTRDFTVDIPFMSDMQFGSTGFRFVKIELLSQKPVLIQSICAVSKTTIFPNEIRIKTNDSKLNKILDTAKYTLSLNIQNGYLWDGIKRDRLVWCGDLHQEILTALYCYGNIENIPDSLDFLRKSTPVDNWMNGIPTYSAWWVINLCDYCSISGDKEFFDNNKDYAVSILNRINDHIDNEGNIEFAKTSGVPFFLDWPTYETEDAEIGTAALLIWAAKKYKKFENFTVCNDIVNKLQKYLSIDCKTKQVKAFQVIAGAEKTQTIANFLQKNGASGFSTFMTYYILSAYFECGGKNSLDLIKEYFGGMLSRGATTFWEDFDICWLKDSGRIDELPQKGQKDIHGDFGRFCYEGFRHSLCHGWSSGVFSFFIEKIVGLKLIDGFNKISVTPNLSGLKHIRVTLPTPYGKLSIDAKENDVKVKCPKGILQI